MCGICGKYNVKTNSAVEPERIRQMAAVLRHRGPDGEGFYCNGPLGLGHRRLSIIDLEGGEQPMFNEDGSLAIVFNGEIYNYKDLRERLQKHGHLFKSQSDTEVLVHAYEQWGEGFLQHIRGMFALAIWDERKKQLFLARDRVGIKPLYYYWDGATLLFASEIKAILQDPTVAREIDPRALDDFLTYMYIPAPKTIFKRIRKLRPGHFMTVDANGVSEREYWDIAFDSRNGMNESDWSSELLAKLRESVACHLISDVPLGAFLSGGIDSSAVVGIMSGLLEQPVNTASIGFRESAFDELPFAQKVASLFKTRGYEKVVDARAAEILDTLVWHFDEPFADSSMVPTYYVSQVARERVTVCLSGDGGDENFAGYRRYRFDVAENHIRSVLPASLRSPFFGTLAKIYPKADWLPQVLRAKTTLVNLSLTPERGYFHTMSWFGRKMKNQLYSNRLKHELQGYDPFSVMLEHFDKVPHLDPLSRIQYVDIKTYLVDDILTKVDRASMAHSLEVRVPILDHEFMELAARIPSCYKLRNGEGKYIFKQALDGLLPRDILYRPKRGFSMPLAKWLRTDLKKVFENRVLAKNAFVTNYFEPAPIRQWWAQHQRGTRDFAFHLWALLVLEAWGRKLVG